MKRSIIGVALALSLFLAPLAHADSVPVPIGDPYTDTLQLWSEIASALSSLAGGFAALFDGAHFAAASPVTPPAALAAAAANAVPAQQPTQQVITYTVQPGDTLSGIAQSYNVSLAPLLAANDLSQGAILRPGENLIIPDPQTAPATTSGATSNATSGQTTTSQNVKSAESSTQTTAILSDPAPAFNASNFVTQSELAAQLNALTDALSAQFGQPATTTPPQYVAADGNGENPFAAVNAINNLSNVTISNSTIDAASIPDLSASYLSIGGGTLTGGLTVNGDALFASASTTNLEMTEYAEHFPGTDIGAQVDNAYAALPSYGGVIVIPAGSYTFSTQMNFNTNSKPVLLQCAPGGATTLSYTGSATSTIFNTGEYAPGGVGVPSGYGIDGCTLVGPYSGAGDTSVGVQVGGSNGAPGIVISGSRIVHFGIGVEFSANAWIDQVNTSVIEFNNTNDVVLETANNSGESMRFIGDTFGDVRQVGDVGSCVDLVSDIASAEFTDDSFDDCAVNVGTGNLNVNFDGDHFENPNEPYLGSYSYITIASSGYTSVEVSNSTLMNDGATTAASPYQYIYNGAHLTLSGDTFDANGAGLPAAAVQNYGSHATLDVFGIKNTGNTSAYGAIATSSENFVVDSNNSRIISSDNVGIFNSSPAYPLDVVGFINVDPSSGYKQGGNTVLYASTTTDSLAVGASSAAAWMAATSSQSYSVAVGQTALRNNTTGIWNTAVGQGALLSNLSGEQNAALGAGSLNFNTTGIQNTAVGYQALNENVTGSQNTAVGASALLYNTSATNTVAIGAWAGQGTVGSSASGENVFIGETAGQDNTTGSNNVTVGYQSGRGITTGAQNTLIGSSFSSLSYNQITTGADNISIGYNVAIASSTLSDQLDIGNFIYGTGLSGTGASVSPGMIGIGTASPYSRLQVTGPDTASTSAFAVVNSASTTVFSVFDDGNSTYSGSIFQSSDQRLKTDVQSLDASSSLAAIEQLNPVSYFRIDQPGTEENLGFIAQQVQQIFPNLLSTTSATALTPDGTLTLNYEGLIAPIVSAIQEISADINSIENTLAGFAESFVSNQITASQELCVGSTCVTPAQFQAMVAAANVSQSSGEGSGGASSDDAQATDTPPVIQVSGDNAAIIQVGATYSDLGATIEGPQQDLNLGLTTYVNGTEMDPVQIDTTEVATDTVNYVATDQSGLTSTSTRTVIIEVPANDNQATSTPANDNSPPLAATSTVQ